ncbi:response regulator [Rubrobacter marinus]|uniref:response regulator n=1 Tax=Rubrobacter marinus TaxID=2653852 RepID=UPI003899E639
MGREPDLEVVAQTDSVAEGRRRMAEGGIDAAVVDVPLFDEYGVALVQELHDADPSIPVLVLSHALDREDREKLLEAGADEVLSKEVGFEEILAAVRGLGREARGEGSGVRVLISYEESHLAYRDALVAAVRALRPQVAVTAVGLPTLGSEVGRSNPHLVVSSRPNTVDPGGRPAWYTLAAEPDDPSELCVDGRREASENPGLEDLLAAIDEVEEAVRAGRELGGC